MHNSLTPCVVWRNPLLNADDDAAIGGQTERAVVVNLTDEVQFTFVCIGRNLNDGFGLIRLSDDDLGGADLRLLPPKETEPITIRVKGFRGVHTNGEDIILSDTRRDGYGNRVIGYGYRGPFKSKRVNEFHLLR